jgi:uncharacterized membrane protein
VGSSINSSNSLFIYVIFIFGGLFIGATVLSLQVGAVLGGILGYLLASNFLIRSRLGWLEKLQTADTAFPRRAAPEPVSEVTIDGREMPFEEEPLTASFSRSAAEASATTVYEPDPSDSRPPAAASAAPSAPEPAADRFSEISTWGHRIIDEVKKFFTTGNIILKIGLIVLFFGVSFLLKYAAQRNLIPIELRLTAVGLGGMALLGIGWRLRHRQLFYGLLLQGGGVGILYLTIFAATKLYHLLPFALAFSLMVGIVALSGFLAVLQNEKWLAIFGSIGGFLAPVLLSTGGGSHVALFSYYFLLNLGILGIAWFKAWRELNLLGFVFTFAIGSLWGKSYYHPVFFASVEPFLLSTFLLYVAISVLFSLKQPVDLKGYIDPPLVFGVPIATFALQYCLVKDFEHGLALSAIGFGLFYMLSASALWRRDAAMRMLVEIFLSFGVVFGSLAIPLALDGYWITAAWALEGAALIWVGVRQVRLRARLFGILLQFGAGISFLEALRTAGSGLPILNGLYLSCVLLAWAALFSSYFLNANAEKIQPWEGHLVIPLLVWGLGWWFGGGMREIDHYIRPAEKANIFLLFSSFSCLTLTYAARKLSWRHLVFPPLLLLPVLVVLSLRHFGGSTTFHLFAGWGSLCWAVALTAQYLLLLTSEKDWPHFIVSWSHSVVFWLILLLLSREGTWLMERFLGHDLWPFVAQGVIPAAGIMLLKGPGRKLVWPVGRFTDAYQHIGIAVVVLYLCGWSLLAVLRSGDPAPLPFLPLANPLEVFQMVVLLACWSWAWQKRDWLRPLFDVPLPLVLYCPAAAIIFLWLNAAVGRTVHFYGHVPYDLVYLFRSILFQAAISILWSLTALGLMMWAARKYSRQVWMLGAGLLALVVAKLFIVDLAGTATIGRIVSFLVVGLLMLLIGYVSPLPPRKEVSA